MNNNDNWINRLYFGDCLEVLKDLYNKNKNGFIDLVYIDPPFNSKRNYNILFENINLEDTKAQTEAFADTWSNVSYKDTLQEIKEVDLDLFSFLESLDNIRISQSAVSYLTTMAIRIWYINKVLKDTGSFYLHCDSTMSHYLKLVCDLVFNERNFRNEIIWERTFNTGSSKSIANKFPQNTDSILFYAMSEHSTFNRITRPLNEGALKRYDKEDEKGRYMWVPLKTVSAERLQKLRDSHQIREEEGLRYPRYKKYLNEEAGAMVSNLWSDIGQISTHPDSIERLGYPTQKPEALLERIISASSNEGDLVGDFFCGCGTTISAAQKLKRKWLGVDISHLAIGLIERKRLIEPYLKSAEKPVYEIHGFPKDIASAKQLAEHKGGRFEFQHWIIEAKLGGIRNPKDTADGGWDGYTTIGVIPKEKDIILIEVKSGGVNVKNLREFIQVVNKNKACIGILVCFADEVTKPMLTEAKSAGYYRPELFKQKYDKIQILTVEDLLENKGIDMPNTTVKLFKTAENVKTTDATQNKLF
ncbi:MAG: DNA methyltransferase [Bacteroidales bacterium]|jgi:DNA modification methylase